MKEELSQLRAELAAQKVVTFKLFEALLFMAPSSALKMLRFLDQYAQDAEQESDPRMPHEAAALRGYLAVLKQANNLREAAASTREALGRIKRRAAAQPQPPQPDVP